MGGTRNCASYRRPENEIITNRVRSCGIIFRLSRPRTEGVVVVVVIGDDMICACAVIIIEREKKKSYKVLARNSGGGHV